MKVSVVLPAYNAEKTIAESIQSIVNQTFEDWELLVIDDGSTDRTGEIIKSFTDKRIKYVRNEKNMRLIYTLNRGLSMARGEYIARMDADDISMPLRFEKQVALMDSNPQVVVCGTQIEMFGEGVATHAMSWYVDNENLKKYFLIQTPIVHPTAMIRADVIRKHNITYNTGYQDSEDYKFWLDLIDLGDFQNIGEPLLRYRISATQCTQPTNATMWESQNKCRYDYLEKFYGADFSSKLRHKGVSIDLLRLSKSWGGQSVLSQSLYFSMKKFDWKLLIYYLIVDSRHYSLKDSLRVIKRFLGLRPPIFFTKANHSA